MPTQSSTAPFNIFGDKTGVPVLIGVSGHRDLVESDISDIRATLQKELSQIEAMTRHSPRVLLSGMAKGADQIAAEEALARGWQVVALLPMPLDAYWHDFLGEDDKQALRSLLDQCAAIYELPWAIDLDADISDKRDQQYREQGIFLTRQVQAVITLWDGEPRKPGACGTSLVVDICRRGVPPISGEVLTIPETTGMIHVPVRRQVRLDRPMEPASSAPSDSAHVAVVEKIDCLNRTISAASTKCPALVKESLDGMLPVENQEELDTGTRYILNTYAETDALAKTCHHQRKYAILAVSLATVCAAVCQATYGVVSAQPWIIAYGISIVLAYGLYFVLFRLDRFRIEDRFLEYRAFSEASRVQIFWRLSGLRSLVAEHYLQLVKSNVGWVREAMRNVGFTAQLMNANPTIDTSLVRDKWILEQKKYFDDGATKRRKMHRRLDAMSMIAMATGLSLLGVSVVAVTLPALAPIKTLATAYSASFFLLAAVLNGYAMAMSYAEEASTFEKAAEIFGTAREAVSNETNTDHSRFQACVLALGKHALAENADWLLLHRRNAFQISQ